MKKLLSLFLLLMFSPLQAQTFIPVAGGGGGGGVPGGTSGQIQYNNAGAFGGVSVIPAANGGTGVANASTITLGGNLTTSGAFATTLTTTGATTVTLPTSGTLATLGANTFTGQQVVSANGVASTPPILASGNWFSGGTTTTTKPAMLIEPAGTVSTSWQTAGTGLGINAPSGFPGNFVDFQVNGAQRAYIRSDGYIVGTNIGSSGDFLAYTNASRFVAGASNDVIISRKAAANWQLGAADAAAPVAQTLSVQSVVAGTTNTAGQNFTVQGSTSTGTGLPGTVILQTGGSGAAATAQNAFVTGLTINSGVGAGTIKHPTFTVAALPSCPTVGAGSEAFVTDATAPTYNAALTGGGAVGIPVFCDGTIWKSH